MKVKMVPGVCAVLLVGLTVGALPLGVAQAATTFFVSSTAGSDANPCTSVLPCQTIGHAIVVAGAGDTISLAADTYTTPAETFPLTISKSLTITGAGASSTIIDANQTDRVFSVTGTANVSIAGVTIQHGSASGNGGGIDFNSSGTLSLADCIVTKNSAKGISSGGGLIQGNGGGIAEEKGTVTLTNCTVSANTAQAGGGIAEEGGGVVNLMDSTINNNQADDNGGGIVEDGGGTVNLTRCTVSGNTSTIDGGGIAEEGSGTVNLINCTVSGNSSASSGGSTFGGGIAGDGGGTVNMNNTTISNNRATTGGGIDNNSGDHINLANTIVAENPQGGDCSGSITSDGHNLDSDGTCGLSAAQGDIIGKNPLLGPLQLNPPGTTATQGLIVGSLAVDGGNPGPSDGIGNHCEPTDQRGVSRPVGPACDIGAFEGQIAAPPTPSGAPALGTPALLLTALGLAGMALWRLRSRSRVGMEPGSKME